MAVQVMAHNLARWTAAIGIGEKNVVTTPTLRRRFIALPGRITRSARRFTLHLPAAPSNAGAIASRSGRMTRAIAPESLDKGGKGGGMPPDRWIGAKG